jgi:hypothetical protein
MPRTAALRRPFPGRAHRRYRRHSRRHRSGRVRRGPCGSWLLQELVPFPDEVMSVSLGQRGALRLASRRLAGTPAATIACDRTTCIFLETPLAQSNRHLRMEACSGRLQDNVGGGFMNKSLRGEPGAGHGLNRSRSVCPFARCHLRLCPPSNNERGPVSWQSVRRRSGPDRVRRTRARSHPAKAAAGSGPTSPPA